MILDGLWPVDNRPYTDKPHKFSYFSLWHVIPDMWHMTNEIMHMTCHNHGMLNIGSKCLVTSSMLANNDVLWHIRCDMWHVTRGMWHMTNDTHGMLSNVSNFRSLALMAYSYDVLKIVRKRITDWPNQWMNDKGVCKTALVKPKLDGVGPVDNRPSTDYFPHLFKNKTKIWHVTGDMWQVTHDMWHVTCDTWHVPCDTWWGVNILSKFQLSSSYGLGKTVYWRYFHKGWLNHLGKGSKKKPGKLYTFCG